MNRRIKVTALLITGVLLCNTEPFILKVASVSPMEKIEEGSYEEGELIVLYDKEEKNPTLSNEEVQILSETEEGEIALVEVNENKTVEEAIEEYEKLPEVLAVTPNYTIELLEAAKTDVVNDTYISQQSYLSEINAYEAWNYAKDKSREEVLVAVLDTGADYTHPDIKHAIDRNKSAEILDDKGTIGPLMGDDYHNGVHDSSGAGHGTHVCGIIAAEANNGMGIAGVGSAMDNSMIRLMAVDVFKSTSTTTLSRLIYGMEYARQQGAKIINLSAGVNLVKSSQSGNIINDEILKLECEKLKNNGIILVCAAGNDNMYDNGVIQEVPSDYDTTIGVVCLNSKKERWSLSNYGLLKDIAAPGVSIYSTMPGGTYRTKTGTSMATPIVTATIAMMKALDPALTFEEIRLHLKESSDSLSSSNICRFGAIHAENALKRVETKERMPFQDVHLQDWFYDSVLYVYKQNLMKGLSETVFAPADTLARAQFALILYRMAGESEVVYEDRFQDVVETDWYADSVFWASSKGIVKGYEHNQCFGPADCITREQLVIMLYRYMENELGQTVETKNTELLKQYPDAWAVSGFATEAMTWAIDAGILRGDQGLLLPQGQTNRAECATMLKRFQDYISP